MCVTLCECEMERDGEMKSLGKGKLVTVAMAAVVGRLVVPEKNVSDEEGIRGDQTWGKGRAHTRYGYKRYMTLRGT